MVLRNTSNLYLMSMYVYMKTYQEAIKQKFAEKIDRIAREMSE